MALFDIKPIDDNGAIDVKKIHNIQSVINLGRKFKVNKKGEFRIKSHKSRTKNEESNVAELNNEKDKPEILNTEYETQNATKNHVKDLEKYLNEDIDPIIELTAIGAEFYEDNNSKPRYQPIFAKQKLGMINEVSNTQKSKEELDNDYETIIRQINKKILSIDGETFLGEPKKIDAFSLGFLTLKTPQKTQSSNELNMRVEEFSKKEKTPKLSRTLFLIIGIGLISFSAIGHYGINIKNRLIVEGNSAVANLQSAGENIKNMDFSSASGDFAQAYQEFSKAGDDMNFMGAGISTLLSDLPGAGKLKSVKNLVEAGKLMANAGQAMSDAMGEIAKTNLILLPTSDVLGTSDVQAL